MKQLKKDAKNMIVLGVGMGVGASAITGAGGSAAGVSAMTGKMGTLGSVVGTGAVLRGIKKIGKNQEDKTISWKQEAKNRKEWNKRYM